MTSINELRLKSNNKTKIIFDGGELSSDGGMLLLKDFMSMLRIPEMFRQMFSPNDIRRYAIHSNADLLLQAIVQIIAGYFRDDSADTIRKDPVITEVVGKNVLASQPTMSRFFDRLHDKSIEQLELILQELRKRAYSISRPEKVIFDLDTTLLPTYGKQLGSSYNAHYQANGYHPQLCFDGITGDLLKAELRKGSDYCCKGVAAFMEPLLQEYRDRYPDIRLYGRGDSGYATPELYELFENYKVTYVIRLKNNSVLEHKAHDIKKALDEKRDKDYISYAAAYGEFQYQASTWSHARRVVCKIQKPANTYLYEYMFVVTNDSESAPEDVVKHYCGRGNMENFIKESKNGFDFRTVSSLFMPNNANRLQVHVLAYNIFNLFRRLTLPEHMKSFRVDTIRLNLLKVAVKVVHRGRYLVFRFASSFPYKKEFAEALRNIQNLYPLFD